MTIIISRVEKKDLPEVLKLLPQLTTRKDSLAAKMPEIKKAERIWDELLSAGNLFSLKAEHVEDKIIVGFLVVAIIPNLTWDGHAWAIIENVVVHEKYRREGIGKDLINFAKNLATKYGCYKVQLISGTKPEQKSFYESCGFENSNCLAHKTYLVND